MVIGNLLTTLARVHDEKRGDPRAAISVYERLVEHDPSDPTPLDALESLHTMVGDWHGLTRVFSRKVEQAFDTQERGELLRRLGSVHEELLADRTAAIAAYKRAVAEDDTDTLAYEALDRLYSVERKPEELAAVLQRRIELAVDPGERVDLGLRLGAVYDRLLHQVDSAIAAYKRVLDDDATHAQALLALAAAFERQGMWGELLENLVQQESVAQTPAERVRLLQRQGEILEQRQGEVDAAIDRYRDALEIDSSSAQAIDALIRITRLSEHRARAAEILEPLLRAHRRFDDLVQLIEGGLPSLDDSIARRAELQRLAELHEHSRGSAQGCVRYAVPRARRGPGRRCRARRPRAPRAATRRLCRARGRARRNKPARRRTACCPRACIAGSRASTKRSCTTTRVRSKPSCRRRSATRRPRRWSRSIACTRARSAGTACSTCSSGASPRAPIPRSAPIC